MLLDIHISTKVYAVFLFTHKLSSKWALELWLYWSFWTRLIQLQWYSYCSSYQISISNKKCDYIDPIFCGYISYFTAELTVMCTDSVLPHGLLHQNKDFENFILLCFSDLAYCRDTLSLSCIRISFCRISNSQGIRKSNSIQFNLLRIILCSGKKPKINIIRTNEENYIIFKAPKYIYLVF